MLNPAITPTANNDPVLRIFSTVANRTDQHGGNELLTLRYLQNGAVEEQSQQLNEVVENIALFLLHAYDVWGEVGLVLVQFQVLIPRKEAELEEIFYYDRHLRMDDRNKSSHSF